jgi:hypothetical protein
MLKFITRSSLAASGCGSKIASARHIIVAMRPASAFNSDVSCLKLTIAKLKTIAKLAAGRAPARSLAPGRSGYYFISADSQENRYWHQSFRSEQR